MCVYLNPVHINTEELHTHFWFNVSHLPKLRPAPGRDLQKGGVWEMSQLTVFPLLSHSFCCFSLFKMWWAVQKIIELKGLTRLLCCWCLCDKYPHAGYLFSWGDFVGPSETAHYTKRVPWTLHILQHSGYMFRISTLSTITACSLFFTFLSRFLWLLLSKDIKSTCLMTFSKTEWVPFLCWTLEVPVSPSTGSLLTANSM